MVVGFPLACTQYEVLEPDPRTLGPNGLVRRPGAEAHYSCACSMQMSENLSGGAAPFTAGHSGGSTRVMCGKWHFLGVFCLPLLEIVSLAVSN